MPAARAAVVVDRGWAWMVCLGLHCALGLSSGYVVSLGILYIEWKQYFDSSATASSWILGMPWLLGCPVCLVSWFLVQRVSLRKLALFAAGVNGLASISGSLMPELWQLYLCSAMTGITLGIMLPVTLTILPRYFQKRYAFANGLCLVGINVGQILFPPLLRVLIEVYGWRGAMFISGAIQMNGVAACALFRPQRSGATASLQNGGPAAVSEPCPREKRSGCHTPCLRLPADCPLLVILAAVYFYSTGWIINLTHFPARSKEAGWSDDRNAALLTVYAVSSLVARAFHGYLVDRKFISAHKLLFLGLGLASAAALLNPVSDSYAFLATSMALTGVSLGISSPLIIVTIKKLISESEQGKVFSLYCATLSLAHGVGPVVAGKVFDLTGNYVLTFIFAGAMFVISLLVFILVVYAHKRFGHAGLAVPSSAPDHIRMEEREPCQV